MKKLNLRLLRTIQNTKGQYIAVIMVVIVGLLIYTSFAMTMDNLETTLQYYYDETNMADVFVQTMKLPDSALNTVSDIEGVVDVQGRIVYDVNLKTEDEERVKVRVVSLPEVEEEPLCDVPIKYGREIVDLEGEVQVLEQFAEARGIEVGDTIELLIQGKEYEVTVSSTVYSPEYVYLVENEQVMLQDPAAFGVVFVSQAFAEKAFGLDNYYNELLVKTDPDANGETIVKEIEKKLDKYGVKRAYPLEDQLSNRMLTEEIKGGKVMANSVPVLFLGVAAGIIIVMVHRLVRNDRVSIGIMKSMGYTNRQLMGHYAMYSLGIGVIGAFIGILSGTLLSGVYTKMYADYFFKIPMLKLTIYPTYIIAGIWLSSLFCVGAGVVGARSVVEIDPATSMRPEAPKINKGIFLEKFPRFWSSRTFTEKMIFRNVFRSKKRLFFIGLGIAVTYAIIVVPFYMLDMFDFMFIAHYEEFQKMDYSVNYSVPIKDSSVMDISKMFEVDDIEGKIDFPFEIENGWKKKVVNVVGVQPDTVFYEFMDTSDEIVTLPEEGILLAEGLANYLGVSVGDTVKVNTYLPGRDDVYVEVKDIVKQALGINGYMDINYMQEIMLDEGVITGVFINSEADVSDELSNVKNISSVQSTQDLIDTFMEFLDLTYAMIFILVGFGGILGFAIIYNSTIMSINERTLEFSSLRVMGFTKNELFKMVVTENMVMTGLGVLAGIPLAKLFIQSMANQFSTDLYTMYAIVNPKVYFYGGVATVLFVILSQLATYSKIHKLDFIEALKSRTT